MEMKCKVAKLAADWAPENHYSIFSADTDLKNLGADWVEVDPEATVTFTLPSERELVARQVEHLKALKRKLSADAEAAQTKLTEKINQLLAIANEVK